MPSSNMVGFFWIIHFHIHGERKREEKKESQLDWSITGKPGKRMNLHKPWGPSVELRLQEMVGQTSLVTSCKALGSGRDLEECQFAETSRRGTTNSGKKCPWRSSTFLWSKEFWSFSQGELYFVEWNVHTEAQLCGFHSQNISTGFWSLETFEAIP